MKKYISFLRIRFITGLQYRAAAWGGIATQFAWGGMTILMFKAFYESDASAFPMEFSQLASYIWLQQALLTLFNSWFFDNEIFETITSGSIAYEMCRPFDMYAMWFTKNVATRLSRVVLRCLPIIIFAILLPAPYNLSAPSGIITFLLFIVSSIFGLFVIVSLGMLLYISAFYTISTNGIKVIAVSTIDLLTGALIPIPFFPEWLQPIMFALPFASIQSTPFLIYVGQMSGMQVLSSITLQAFWIVALVIIGKLMMKNALKKVVAQGG